MPVKVRCRGCEKVLTAPDKARGKVVKCPNCQTMLKVPGGKTESKPQAAAKPSEKSAKREGAKASGKKAEAKSKIGSETDFFSNLDFGQAEDTENRICPYCATDLEEDNDVCPGCGMNVAMGKMDKREAKKRSRKGPDPALFYKAAWTESLAFVKKNKSLALRTGSYLTIFVVLCWSCYFMHDYSTNGPPRFFWGCCTFLCALGLPGWFFFLSMKVVDFSLSREKKMDRIHFDFFQCVTLGMRTIFWPAVMLIPFAPLIAFVGWLGLQKGDYTVTQILIGILGAFPLCVLPLAIVHMTAKYTYKAWILWEMVKVFGRNVAPAIYWVFLAMVTFILPFGGIFWAIQEYGGGLNPYFNVHFMGITSSVMTSIFEAMDMDPSGWLFYVVIVPIRFALAFVVAVPLLILTGFPLVFLMRANGLLAYYRQQYLDLVQKMAVNTPAGFWVRMLAYIVDVLIFPLSCFIVTAERRILMFAWLLNGMALAGFLLMGLDFVIYFIGPIWLTYNYWMYFAVLESTTQRTTIAKDSFGLIVSTSANKKMSLRESSIRLVTTFSTLITAGLGFLMCAFHPEKKALHDLASKTKVVWHGDR
ncbi:MAG: RDD family protein [Planctomycetaceae bacterium]|nr:RDD family protein [Planctomycetaceae bacterium]